MIQITTLNGQIRRGEKSAEKLYELVKQEDIHIIVEIGTWKGMGSTKCILDGIMDSRKKNYEVFSLECNKLFHEEAKINLGWLPPNFHLLNGSIFDAEKLMEIRNDPNVHLPWLEEDISGIKNSRSVINELPNKIDLLIIDGGEYSGEIEFNILKDRTTYFYFDDISSYKNKNNANYVRTNDNFKVLYDDGAQTLICKKI